MMKNILSRGFGCVQKMSNVSTMKINLTQVYRFSTQIEKPNLVKSKLLKIVEKENKYEVENYQVDETVNEYLQKVGFELIENEGDNNVEMQKQVGDALITIHFQSRSPNQEEGEEQQQEEGQQQQGEGEGDQQYQDYADFTVYIQKQDGKSLCYECSSVQSEIQVNQVSVVNDVTVHKKTPRFERGINSYGGPEFSTLDERMQTSLVQYLKSFGVNEELAAFVEHYSLDKEQRLYMSWLKQLETYLKN